MIDYLFVWINVCLVWLLWMNYLVDRFGTRWLKMIQKLRKKALEWWKLLKAYVADVEAHMYRLDDVEMGLCHDLMRQTMLLSWDFALMRWSEVWCESWLNPSRDHSKHVDNLKGSSSWLIMDCSRGSLSLYEDSRQEGWLGGLDLVVVEGSSMLKSKSTWGAHNDYR